MIFQLFNTYPTIVGEVLNSPVYNFPLVQAGGAL